MCLTFFSAIRVCNTSNCSAQNVPSTSTSVQPANTEIKFVEYENPVMLAGLLLMTAVVRDAPAGCVSHPEVENTFYDPVPWTLVFRRERSWRVVLTCGQGCKR